MYQAIPESPPTIAMTIPTPNSAGRNVEQTVKIDRNTNPTMPKQAVTLPNALLRSMINEKPIAAFSVKKKPTKLPGVKSAPLAIIASPAAAKRVLWPSVVADVYLLLRTDIGIAALFEM